MRNENKIDVWENGKAKPEPRKQHEYVICDKLHTRVISNRELAEIKAQYSEYEVIQVK
jgi:hypothetical protein